MRPTTPVRWRNGTRNRLGVLQGGRANDRARNLFANPIRQPADESGVKIYNVFMGGSAGSALGRAPEDWMER